MLIADTRQGNRPSFTDAAAPDVAQPLYEGFCAPLEAAGVRVVRVVFGVPMRVSLVNDGRSRSSSMSDSQGSIG